MKGPITTAITLMMLGASTLAAQVRPVRPPTRNWVSVYAAMFTSMGEFDDPDTASHWVFEDNAFGMGASLMRELGQGLLVGIDASASRPEYERRTLTGPVTIAGSGTATVATAMLTGRYASGGGAQVGFYVTGGFGTVAYKLADLDGWNTDFGLRAGTGLEYRYSDRGTIFLEWGRLWGYHEDEGVSGGRVNHSQLRLGGRFGF